MPGGWIPLCERCELDFLYAFQERPEQTCSVEAAAAEGRVIYDSLHKLFEPRDCRLKAEQIAQALRTIADCLESQSRDDNKCMGIHVS